MAQSELEKINSSSTEEEEEEEELSSESSDSESDLEKKKNNINSSSSSMKPHQPTSKSSAGDSPPKHSETADPNIKPSASKPMDDDDDGNEPLRKPRPKNPTSRYSPPPLKSATPKRKAADLEAESKKEAVAVAAVASEIVGEKKLLFQRLWSEEDEIQLIKGMIDYVEKKGKEPIADVNEFHEFVKSSLNIDVNNAQMSAKIKRLKAKFMNNIGKIEQKGKVRSLSNPHEKIMYELSEKLWGRDRKKNASLVSCSTKKVNAKGKPLTNLKRKNGNSGEANASNGIGVMELSHRGVMMTDEDIMRKGLELVSGAKKVELEEKWGDLKLQEFKHFLKKLELMHEQAELLLSVIDESEAS